MIPFSPPLLVRTRARQEGLTLFVPPSYRLALGCIAFPVQSQVARPGHGAGLALFFLCCDEEGEIEMIEAATVAVADARQLDRLRDVRLEREMKGGDIDQTEKED